MTRYRYGGGGDSEVNAPSGIPRASTPANVYDSGPGAGGTLITDIQKLDGTALAGTVTTDAYGQAVFLGPNNYTKTLWLDFGVGPRWAVSPKDIDQPNAGGQVIADQRTVDYAGRTATPKSAIPTNASDLLHAAAMTALDSLVIPRFPSAATRDAAFPSPADGDTCYRTDRHARQVYSGSVSRWVADATLLGEATMANSTTTAVTFSSIPADWTNLRLLVRGRCAASAITQKWGVQGYVQFNGDSTAANYGSEGWERLTKNTGGTNTYGLSLLDASGGSTTASAPIPTAFFGAGGEIGARIGVLAGESTPANMTSFIEVLIPNYASTIGHQDVSGRSGGYVSAATSYMLGSDHRAGWANTAAITSVTFSLFTGGFMASGTKLSLYGF